MSNLYHEEGPPADGGFKVMLATPSYGNPDASYTFSMARSREALAQAGIKSAYLLLQGHCHVDDSRNSIVRHFLASDCTDLVFLDADVSWQPEGLVKLCQHDRDLVGAVYPYRRASDTMPVRFLDARLPDSEGMLEVDGLPTGFMKIKRHVLEALAAKAVVYLAKGEPTAQIFERLTDEHGTRWGGDIAFCRKWREAGGRIYADTGIWLGHTATVTYKDSLGSFLRRKVGLTIPTLIPRIRAGNERPEDYDELFKFGGNDWGAEPDVLALCVGVARKCRGPIIEAGSGLSSVLMAAANPEQEVHALEHLDLYAGRTRDLAKEAGVKNLTVHCVPSDDLWYDLKEARIRHNKFAFGFCDGPPRLLGTRMRFFDELAPRCTAIAVDDFSDYHYAKKVKAWAQANGRNVRQFGRAALLMKEAA